MGLPQNWLYYGNSSLFIGCNFWDDCLGQLYISKFKWATKTSVSRWLSDVGRCPPKKTKLIFKPLSISTRREGRSLLPTRRKQEKRKEYSALIWLFLLLASKSISSNCQLSPLSRVCLRAIMGQFLPMGKQAPERLTQWKATRMIHMKRVSSHEPLSISSHQLKVIAAI